MREIKSWLVGAPEFMGSTNTNSMTGLRGASGVDGGIQGKEGSGTEGMGSEVK